MLRRRLLVLLALAVCLPLLRAPAARGGEERVWRQYPEMPEILYFENFEASAHAWKNGKLEVDPVNPRNHCYKLELAAGNNDKCVTAYGELPLNIPGGINPGEVHIQISIWADNNVAEMWVKLKNADYEDKPRPNKFGQWVPLPLPLTGFTKDRKPPTKDHNLRVLEITIKPRDKGKPLNAYVDDVVITAGPRPADVLGRVMALELKRKDLIRAADKEGFTFNSQIQQALQSMLKRRMAHTKPKTVLVVGARGKDTEGLIAGMKENAAKIKGANFTFARGEVPDSTTLTGLDDMRPFLTYCAQKTEAETAVLVLGYGDVLRPGRPGDQVRVVLERLMDSGLVPIVCLPAEPPGGDKNKLDGFNNNVANLCTQLGLPWLDQGTCIRRSKTPKDVKDPKPPPKEAVKDKDGKEVKEVVKEAKDFPDCFDGRELSAVGVQAVAAVATEAVRQLDTYVFGRK